ncbi:glycerophosphodiester phosphodiesterase [Sphingorhabdus arenilitoris]|uniref:glycerophosphodiester phosphodiesterase n=1 Tax=Sphingorhabdus arenilitoris TaxID=1490041 RepID=A0ABV8RGG6_9SPHN
MTDKPIIIAHRGLSGEWPEHTIGAYRAAIEAGADYVEPDLVLTKDGILVARHENEISGTTNVADHPEFADRKTTKIIDGEKFSGWFTEDFTLAELKTLRAKERLPQLRSTGRDGRYDIPTFEEILHMVARYNVDRAVPVGVYPETKHPSYFTSIGLPHEAPLLQLLTQYGYQGRNAAVFIQSFEVGNLKALRQKTDLPLIQLIAADGGPADIANGSYADMISSEGLAEIATYADGIGPDKNLVIGRNLLGQLKSPTTLVSDAHKAGLKVHPWTFRRENYFLPTTHKKGVDPRKAGDLEGEIKAYLAAGVDGIFTDNTPEAVKALNVKR